MCFVKTIKKYQDTLKFQGAETKLNNFLMQSFNALGTKINGFYLYIFYSADKVTKEVIRFGYIYL